MTPKSDLFKQFERQFPGAIETTLVFGSKSEAENYAANSPTAYSGQIISYLIGDHEQRAAIIQPDKTVMDIGGNETGNELIFTVNAGETKEVSVFNPSAHKAVIIEYMAGKARMGTLKITNDAFFEINVIGNNDKMMFSRAGNSVSVNNSADTAIEVNFKLNYFKN